MASFVNFRAMINISWHLSYHEMRIMEENRYFSSMM